MNLRRRSTWIWLFLVFTAVGLLEFGHFYLDDLTRHHDGTFGRRMLEELTGSYSALILIPVLAYIAKHYSWGAGRWKTALAANAVGLLVVTIAHTTLNYLFRTSLSPLFGLGPYDYGDMRVRYYMEASGDAIFYAMMIGTIYFLNHLVAARKTELRAAELQAQLAQATLENLRLQLHPHFLFNTLNAISTVMYEDVSRADRMLAKLSDFLRRVLATSGAETVTLAEEFEIERMYVDIMSSRLERRLTVNMQAGDDALAVPVPFLLLQPLIENAIRHGGSDPAAPLAIGVRAVRVNGHAEIDVIDDGAGYRAGSPPGIGLRNVASRLECAYGDAASFTIAARAGGGTLASLRIPCTQERPA